MLSFSDSVSRSRPMGRRSFLKIGGFGLGSMALPLFGAGKKKSANLPVTGKSGHLFIPTRWPDAARNF